MHIHCTAQDWSHDSPYRRTSTNMVQELHALLASAGIEGPYILVGLVGDDGVVPNPDGLEFGRDSGAGAGEHSEPGIAR